MKPIRLAFLAMLMTQPALAAETLKFTVLRNGEPVGFHSLQFQAQPDGTSVAIDTNVVVKMAMIPVYRFEHHGRELWKDGRLVALSSETNDDGTHHVLKVAGDGGGLSVNGDGHAAHLPVETLPASLWNRGTVTRATLMNTLDGHAMSVQVADLGGDQVAVNGHNIPARHYAMNGDLVRELWYDSAGTLVQMRFKAKDDSDIQYVLR